jgi:hypothetical protein
MRQQNLNLVLVIAQSERISPDLSGTGADANPLVAETGLATTL